MNCYKKMYESLLDDYRELKRFIINASHDELVMMQKILIILEKTRLDIDVSPKLQDILDKLNSNEWND